MVLNGIYGERFHRLICVLHSPYASKIIIFQTKQRLVDTVAQNISLNIAFVQCILDIHFLPKKYYIQYSFKDHRMACTNKKNDIYHIVKLNKKGNAALSYSKSKWIQIRLNLIIYLECIILMHD